MSGRPETEQRAANQRARSKMGSPHSVCTQGQGWKQAAAEALLELPVHCQNSPSTQAAWYLGLCPRWLASGAGSQPPHPGRHLLDHSTPIFSVLPTKILASLPVFCPQNVLCTLSPGLHSEPRQLALFLVHESIDQKRGWACGGGPPRSRG